MKERLNLFFPNLEMLSSSSKKFYIVDFTNSTNSKKGVELSEQEPLIDGFVVGNESEVDVCFSVFEDNSFVNTEGTNIKHCEGVLFPTNFDEDKSWIVFLELKHCHKKKTSSSIQKAREQLFSTLKLFRDNEIIKSNKLVHLIVSLPSVAKSPFENQLYAPHELKKLRKEQYIIFRGVNFINIRTSSSIKA